MSQSNKPDDSFEFTLVSTTEPSTVEVDGYNVIGGCSNAAEQLNDTNETDEEAGEVHEKRLARASGIGSAVLGCLVGGPILAVVLGVGAKYACEQPDASAIRDTARAIGEVAILVHRKFKQIDQDHSIVDESQRALANLWNRAKEADEKHHILEKTKKGLVTGYHATADYVHRHNLIERFILGVGSAMVWFGDKMTQLMAENESRTSDTTSQSRETQRVNLLHQDVHEIRITE